MEPKNIFNKQNFQMLLHLNSEIAQYPKLSLGDDQKTGCNELATKLLYHAATMLSLGNGTPSEFLKDPNRSMIYDFMSGSVLTRVVLETYLIMFEVFLESVSEDESKFRYNCWRLKGFMVHEGISPKEIVQQVRYELLRVMREEVRRELQNTKAFAKLASKVQKRILRGEFPNKPMKQRLANARLGSPWFEMLYKYHSGAVHSDGLAADQIQVVATKAAQLDALDVQQGITMMVIGRMIVEYAARFHDAKSVLSKDPSAHGLANLLATFANQTP